MKKIETLIKNINFTMARLNFQDRIEIIEDNSVMLKDKDAREGYYIRTLRYNLSYVELLEFLAGFYEALLLVLHKE